MRFLSANSSPQAIRGMMSWQAIVVCVLLLLSVSPAWLVQAQNDETTGDLRDQRVIRRELLPAPFAKPDPDQAWERVVDRQKRISEEMKRSILVSLDQFAAVEGISIFVVNSADDLQEVIKEQALDALRLEMRQGPALLILTSGIDSPPEIVVSQQLNQEIPRQRLDELVQKAWVEFDAELDLGQKTFGMVDSLTVSLPRGVQQVRQERTEEEEARRAAEEREAQAAREAALAGQRVDPDAEKAGQKGGLPSWINQRTMTVTIISLILVLVIAGGAFLLLNMYRPVQASPEAARAAAEKRRRQMAHQDAVRRRQRERQARPGMDSLKRLTQRLFLGRGGSEAGSGESRSALYERSRRSLQKRPVAAASNGGGLRDEVEIEVAPSYSDLDYRASNKAKKRRPEEMSFQDWLVACFKEYRALHYGQKAESLTPSKLEELRDHPLFDALEELSDYFVWRATQARKKQDDLMRRKMEERSRFLRELSHAIQISAPVLRKHLLNAFESFYAECEKFSLLPGQKPKQTRIQPG